MFLQSRRAGSRSIRRFPAGQALSYIACLKTQRPRKTEFAPRSPEDEPNERYVEACKKLDYVEYLMDTLKKEARQNDKEQKVA